jgi:phosphate transport system substrate-binding protein
VLALALLLTGCARSAGFESGRDIHVFSREDGSGTRGAFIELFGIELKGDGLRKDRTTKEAAIAKQTDVMLMSVQSDLYAIGYVSVSALGDGVKPVDVDGSRAVTRPFIIATRGKPSGLTRDFIDFILSADGQNVAAKSFIAAYPGAEPFKGTQPAGKISVAGSSSVTPLMEKLREAYLSLNPCAVIEIQKSDSSSGLTAAADGVCDIAMSSRDLKENELSELTPVTIALDGIAVIVNRENPVTGLTKEQVYAIFTGEAVKWRDIIADIS